MIRNATAVDAAGIAELSSTLGRSGYAELIAESLSRIAGDAREVVFVSEAENGDIDGWIHAGQREVLGAAPRAEIVGLVVSARARSRGNGRRLVGAVEEWARGRGLERVVVRSNVSRDVAHVFYQRIGYVTAKTQHVYERELRQD
jgi:GNAT superfamily N-acetyltransferase